MVYRGKARSFVVARRVFVLFERLGGLGGVLDFGVKYKISHK